MSSALIGYTGFVGSNLAKQARFDDFYNSKNIETIQGKTYDKIICAGAPGAKWFANKFPQQDYESVRRLMDCLALVKAKQVVLLSTIDVYSPPYNVYEETPITIDKLHRYGQHRLTLELFVAQRFDCMIVRLPGLFSKGLKKNLIYDVLNNRQLHTINLNSIYQYYSLDNLSKDLDIVITNGIKLLNLATEPVSVKEILQAMNRPEPPHTLTVQPANYDMRTRFASFWNRTGHYLYSKSTVLTEIKQFTESYQ
jgi:nucleoside-diphosphate-sugar epimerase